jgi:tRNA nucleotidyltransferase (CCA-adding enzyme)
LTWSPLEEKVLERLRPGEEEKKHINDVACRLVTEIDKSGKATGMVVGSVARDTWVSGDRDLDVFLLFPATLTREELEGEGLSLARAIAEKFASSYQEKYAEHPYINASIEGLDVDLVPCYAVSSATGIISAVDRTPFHTRFIRERVRNYIDDVLLLKQFAKTGGVYGSDQMTEGFSGYLCELLVLHYGGFYRLLQAATGWRPGTIIEIEGLRAKEFSEPLVVVDPVDPGRNVSASVSLTRMFEFVELARGYLERPSLCFYFPKSGSPMNCDEFGSAIDARGTRLFSIVFRTPPYIEEIIVPQLRKSQEALCSLLVRHGFVVLRSDYSMRDEESILLFELSTAELPPVKRHMGPPLWSAENADKFRGKYLFPEAGTQFSGPYIEDGRYMVELPRQWMHAGALLRSPEVLQTALGKHVKQAMNERWDVKEGWDCWDESFTSFLTIFIRKESPLTRVRRCESETPEETRPHNE